MIIYKVTNVINGKVYIGKTKNTLESRKCEHIKKSKNPKLYFHSALKKYGNDNFVWEVIYECNNNAELNAAEIKFISEYASNKCGYNLTTGGDGGYIFSPNVLSHIGEQTKLRNYKFGNPFKGKTHSEETKKIISEKMKEWNKTNNSPFKGKTHSEETKKIISEKMKEWNKTNNSPMVGKKHSEESKTLMKNARVGWHKSNINGFKGKKHSEETKKQISENTKGRISPNKDTKLSDTHKKNLSKAQTEWLKNNEHPNKGRTWKHKVKARHIEVICPNCGKTGKGPNMTRYHFHNCNKLNNLFPSNNATVQ